MTKVSRSTFDNLKSIIGIIRYRYHSKEKYYGGARAEDGGLLPPLLALAPSHHPPSPPGPSTPHHVKLDYMCPQTENIPSQYMPEQHMDYY